MSKKEAMENYLSNYGKLRKKLTYRWSFKLFMLPGWVFWSIMWVQQRLENIVFVMKVFWVNKTLSLEVLEREKPKQWLGYY